MNSFIVREYSADADRAGTFQVTQEAPVAIRPFVDRLQCYPEALSQHRPDLIALLDRPTHLGRRRRLLVKMEQSAPTSPSISLKADLAMNKADRRGEM